MRLEIFPCEVVRLLSRATKTVKKLKYFIRLCIAKGKLKKAIKGCPEAQDVKNVTRLIQISALDTYRRSQYIGRYLLTVLAELHRLDTAL